MKRVFSNWFECEAGHITVANSPKKVCDAALWEMDYEKGKRKKWTFKEKKTDKKCGKQIIATGEIPQDIDYSKIWDYKIAHAFTLGQVLDAEFIIGLQKEFSKMWEAINGKTSTNS